ncbi:NucA/NucB deoxyribonuclease domain-containing protein [Streptomyces sp. NPDC102340]|uniref:NucA/NucB deoxyribonuclease domain-containing protein n=1 Tax=unclassified Streptomyces TaxID=2593676 RepID=UPI00380A39B0
MRESASTADTAQPPAPHDRQKADRQEPRKACPGSPERPPDRSCDEYPFASTQEGGATGVFSRRMINEDHTTTAGGPDCLLKFCKSNRILNDDASGCT